MYLMMLIFFTVSNNSYASIGCAEWTIVTPGGSIVTHADSWKEKHGTCLKEKKGNKVYISKIIWWQYYEGNIIGKNVESYFIFNEKNKDVKNIDSEINLNKKIKKLKIGKSKSRKMTPQDGWILNWEYNLAKIRLKEKNIDEGIKKRFQEILKKYKDKIYDDGIVMYFKNIDEKVNEHNFTSTGLETPVRTK